jgi:two-component system, sensor histidine kinase YesM
MDLKLTTKIIINFLIIFITFFVIITFSYRKINNSYTINKVSQMSAEIVNAIGYNFDFIIDTVNNQSKILISNNVIQYTLTNGNIDYNDQKQISNYLGEFINFNSMISSIYIFDLKGNKYCIENVTPKDIRLSNIKKQKWYDKLINLNGGYLISVNGGFTFGSESGNYISLIRMVNGLDSQKPIGYLIINISADYINSALYNSNSRYNTKFILRDESGNIFISPEDREFSNIAYTKLYKSHIIQINGMDHILSNTNNRYGWEITSITPFNELKKQSQTYNIIIFIVVLISGILFTLGMAFVSLMITKPIHKLSTAMTAVEKGEFKEAQFETGSDEIGKLKDVYNIMIRQIQKLFENVITENKAKRKKELEVLQSQIKPHFLYNSFDAISSLALSGDNKEIYRIVKALGKFYKGFLNDGNEEITIKHELEIVEQYLEIQKIRFDDKFIFQKNYDSRVFNYTIPRLTLQPLVENAFNHGINPLFKKSVITLEALYSEDGIQLKVSDNGVGMDEDTVKAIKEGRTRGIGLKATIERLRIYYNNPDVFNIKSEKGQGTTITITIPNSQESEKHD